jgi:2-polyprenyl-3-methyl-5-hydroxy-6-metoxy-1,4-benzoquinol methylase
VQLRLVKYPISRVDSDEKIREDRLASENSSGPLKPATSSSRVHRYWGSMYEFGGDEDVVRRIQRSFVPFFRKSSRVLDIGCGRGIFLGLLAAASVDAVGIDNSDEAMAFCQRKGFQVYQENAHSYLKRSREQFDGIFCSHVIEHMSYDDAYALLDLCYDALRPGGVLLLVTPNPQDIAVISEIFWLDPTHVRPYPGPLLKRMLQSLGFRIDRERYFLGDWRLVGRRNLPGYLLRRLLLGRFYGKPNTLVLARKDGHASGI